MPCNNPTPPLSVLLLSGAFTASHAATITDGSFEDPQINVPFTIDEPQPFTFWDNSGVGRIGLGSYSLLPPDVILPPPDGTDQAAYMDDGLGVSQQIGTVSDDMEIVFVFSQGGQGNIGEPGNVIIAIYAGDPLAQGVLLDSAEFPGVGGQFTAQWVLRTATLSTGSDNAGADLYLQLRHGGQGSNVLVDGVCLVEEGDGDCDSVDDSIDNCTAAYNPDQRDTDTDGFGNRCDPDVTGNCIVNFEDLMIFKNNFFVSGDLDTDLDGDGITNFSDLAIVRDAFFGQPGPSALQSC